MSGNKEIGANAAPISMVNLKNEKASLEAQEPKLSSKEHNNTGENATKIPMLKELRKVRIDGSQNTKNLLAEKMSKTKFAADSEENRLTNRFNSRKDRQKDLFKSPNQKETRIGDNVMNEFNCDLHSPMLGLQEKMLSVAALYCGQLGSSYSNRVIEANTSADLLANFPQIMEAIPEAQVPQINNNNVGTEHRRNGWLLFNNLRIIGFCIGLAIILPSFFLAFTCYMDPVPEKVEVPRTLAQRYFYDYI